MNEGDNNKKRNRTKAIIESIRIIAKIYLKKQMTLFINKGFR